MSKFTIKEVISYSWRTTNKNFWFFIRLLLFLFVLQMGVAALQSAAEDRFPRLVVLVSLGSIIIHVIVNMGIISALIKMVDGSKPVFTDIFRVVNPFWRYLGASVLYAILVTVGVILLIIPGIILSLSLQFYTYLIIDQNLSAFNGLWRSWEITKGSRWKLFGLALLLGLINMAGFLLLGVGLLWSIPISMLSIAYVYRTLNRPAGDAAAPAPVSAPVASA